ncbi:MAG TPA: Nramp family divalent metal transporter [Chitinophagaceae bacterium]|nr:Nramp family divalent metal transporter [Chitinophagaceae bacterium]
MPHNTADKSLSEVHQSVDPLKKRSAWRRALAFFGPAYLISVGYMDPGNWATDIAGGSAFGYSLIWVLLMSNLMALLLQSLSARLGIVQGKDLAQCNRYYYPKSINFILYVLAELAIAACDLAEVLGMAIGLNLLLGIPLLAGVCISVLDTFLLLFLQRLGIRKLEAFIIALIAIIGLCFWIEMMYVKPPLGEVVRGFVPSLPNKAALYIAIGIIGATVMPHNLYLHSALVQTRITGTDKKSILKAIRYNIADSAIALNLAFFVNAAILVLAASVFFKAGMHEVASMQEAHKLLAPMLGNQWSSHLFAIALIAAGQSSTVTGTLAGQIVMEGYLRLRINPLLRRMITRLLAVIPAVIVILLRGDKEVDAMLIFSQVILSMQLAFAIIPLIHFVSDKVKMGDFVIKPYVQVLSWTVAIIIIALNLWQLFESGTEWISNTDSFFIKALTVLFVAGFIVLLGITTFYPLMLKKRKQNSINMHPHRIGIEDIGQAKSFNNIALALDFGEQDKAVIAYALKLAEPNTSFTLIHIVESASAKAIGEETQDYETNEDKRIMDEYLQLFVAKKLQAKGRIGFNNRVKGIAAITQEEQADLLIVGSHGHHSIKDFIFGETVNSLRHKVKIPVLIAQ